MEIDINVSETNTENIFRGFYGTNTFIEKSAIPSSCGFKSKKGSDYKGYPDFYKECDDYCIVVEAKATNFMDASSEVQFYMQNNKIRKDIIGIAISGQKESEIHIEYYYKLVSSNKTNLFGAKDAFMTLADINKKFKKAVSGETLSNKDLTTILTGLNKKFNDNNVRDTERSLFFSALMIALNNNNFRNIYRHVQSPTDTDRATIEQNLLEAHFLNKAVLDAVTQELKGKINNLSKEFSWADRFAFIKTVDIALEEYIKIIEEIETKIYLPFKNDEKQDILGRAYKIFLKRAGKVDNKNIILTPDHIKELMVKLARLNVDDVVLDTCTGSGGFLMESMETMIKLAHDNEKKIREIKEKQLIGFEVDYVLFSLACSNMFLHGDGRTNMIYRSSLLTDSKDDRLLLQYIKGLKPTKVIINPPYEGKNPINFVKTAIEYLEPNGKLIVIMPTPTLIKYQDSITRDILKVAKLDYVIRMPKNLFSEQDRTVNTSIFGFTKTPHNYDDEVLFYNLVDDGLVSVQHKGRMDLYNRWEGIEKQVIDSILNSKEIDGISVKKKIYLNGVLNCLGVNVKKTSNYELVKISDIFNVEKGSLASEKATDGDYHFITASEEWKTHISYTHDTEAIVYAVGAEGSLGRAHYVNGKFIASNLCLILTPKNNEKYPVDMLFYTQYLAAKKAEIVNDLADGTSKLTIGKPNFENYYIDYIPIEKQKDISLKIQDKEHEICLLKEKLREKEQLIYSDISDLI